MANENQPPFWLQIKKEYILDNFDNLTSYLWRYSYDREVVNTDYDSTLNCMKSMAEEIGDELRDTPLFRPLELKYGNLLALKLLAVQILASRKAGEMPYESILTLCSLIVRLTPRNDSKTFTALYDIMLNCIHRRKITGLGYGWSDIPTDGNKLQIFILKFQYMTFEMNREDVSYYIDNHGLMVLPPFGMPDITTVNLNRYRTGRCSPVFNISPICRVIAREEICEDPFNFDSVYLCMSQLLDYQKNYTAASFDKRLDYSEDDRPMPVRIIGKSGFRVEAETINPAYNRIKGVVNIRLNPGRPDLQKLRDNLKIGDILLVDLSDEKGYTFEIRDTFEDYYRDVACEMAGQECLAVFSKSYARGTEWLSAEGIRIGVDNSKRDELDEDGEILFSNAMQNHLPIVLKLYDSPQSKKREDFNVYAEIWEIYEEEDAGEIEFPNDPEMAILNSFKEYCASKCDHMSVISNFSDFKEGELKDFKLLPSVFYNFGKYVEMAPVARLKYYISAMMLSRICGNDGDADFIEYECEYLRQLVNFSSNRDVKPLPEPGELFADNKGAALHRSLVATLSRYKRNNEIHTKAQETSVLDEGDEEKLADKISALVSASNSLIGIVDDVEMNDIKHSIARLLSVEDEYVPILDDRTYYGVESINLEFKTSIVAPPYNQRKSPEDTFDPEIQKWAILRTICAFMNSRSGGELLVGVNDVGYAKGVDEDIEQLYRKGFITYKDTDHYLLYLQKMLDHAFLEQDGRRRSNEITRTNVACSQETNAEGVTIVRIKVLPYKEKIIRLAAPASERPANVADAYVRYNASSVPITDGMVHDIMKYKIRRS